MAGLPLQKRTCTGPVATAPPWMVALRAMVEPGVGLAELELMSDPETEMSSVGAKLP